MGLVKDTPASLLRGLFRRQVAAEPVASSTDTSLFDDEPRDQYVVALKKRRKAMMLKKLLSHGDQDDSDLSRLITVRQT